MRKIIGCGFFIIFSLIQAAKAYPDSEESIGLERIVVSKPKACFTGVYEEAAEDFAYLPASSPVEELNFLPVDLQSRMPNSGIQSDFSLRGSNFQGVLMLLNGSRINDPQTGHFNSDLPFTKEDIKSIDVMPGIGSSIFGPDAIGGAINFQIKKPESKRLILELNGGSFDSYGGLFSVSKKITENFSSRISVQRKESAGFSYDTDFKDLTASVSTVLDFSQGRFNTNFGFQEKTFGAFDFYTPGLNFPSKEWTKTYLLDTSLNLNRNGLVIKPGFIWRRHYDKFMLDKTNIKSSYLSHHRNDIFTPSVYFQKEAGFLGRLGLGLEYGQERISSTTLGKHVREHKSFYLDDSKNLTEKFLLGASLRADDFSGFETSASGSINLKYQLLENDALNLGASRNIRIPTFTELYYNDPVTIGDPGLSKEQSINYQAGIEHKTEFLFASATIFFRDEKDMIDWVKTSASQAKFQAANITEDEVYGIEGFAKFKFNDWLSLNANYTYANKRTSKKGYIYKYGENYTRHLGNVLFAFDLPFGPQGLGFTYKKKPGRSGWLIMDTRFSCDLKHNCRLYVNILNLLNTGYEEIVGIPQPGRSIESGLRFEW